MLVAKGLRKRYKQREVVKDFGLTLDAGEVVGLLGILRVTVSVVDGGAGTGSASLSSGSARRRHWPRPRSGSA